MGKTGITLAICGSIVAVTLVIGMITLVAGTATPTASTLGLYGHYTIRIMDSDGNMKGYIQTDNVATHLFKHCMFDSFMGSTLNAAENTATAGSKTCGITTATTALFKIGDQGQTGVDEADLDIDTPYTNTGRADLTGQTVSLGAVEATVTWDNVLNPITILQADLSPGGTANLNGGLADATCVDQDADGLVDCNLDATGLFDNDGELLSHAVFTPNAASKVSAGDLVDMTLTITLT